MSVTAMSWAFKQVGIPTVPRFVLLAMADHANEDDEAWPSVATMMVKTGASERAVRGAIRALEVMGAISPTGDVRGVRADRQTRVYKLNTERTFKEPAAETRGTKCPPSRGAPDAGGHVVPERGAPHAPEPSIEPSSPPLATLAPREVVSEKGRGVRIAPHWKPSDELMAWAVAARPDLDVPAVVEDFRDYWLAASGANAAKRDWNATFRRWIRNQNGRSRFAPVGGRPAKPSPEEQRRADRLAVLEGLGLAVAGDGRADPGEGGAGDFDDPASLARVVGSGRA